MRVPRLPRKGIYLTPQQAVAGVMRRYPVVMETLRQSELEEETAQPLPAPPAVAKEGT